MTYTAPQQYGGATYTGTRWTNAPSTPTVPGNPQMPAYYQSAGPMNATPSTQQAAPLPDNSGASDPYQWGYSQVPSVAQRNAYTQQQQQQRQSALADQLNQMNAQQQQYDSYQAGMDAQRAQQAYAARQSQANSQPGGNSTVSAAPGTAAYNQPITAGVVAPPGAVQTNLGSPTMQGAPMTAAQAMSLMSQGRNVLNQQDAANTVALGRSASVDLANLMNQRQAAIQNQGLASTSLAAGQYGNLLNNALANQQLNSQLWQGNVGLQNQALGQANYLAPLLQQLFG